MSFRSACERRARMEREIDECEMNPALYRARRREARLRSLEEVVCGVGLVALLAAAVAIWLVAEGWL